MTNMLLTSIRRSHQGVPCVAFLIAIVFGALNVAQAANATDTKPNVLFLISDDLRPELGCYGNDVIKTPNIDRLAARGMVFERAYCQQAVCSPSRTSVMTGARPDTTKVWDLKTHFRKAMPDVVTLPQCFRQNGYTTRGYGKVYHSKLDDRPSWSDGKTHAALPVQSSFRFAKFEQDDDIPLTKTDRSAAFRRTNDGPNEGGDARVANNAIAALRELNAEGKPFFLAVGFRKPHLPFTVPKHYWDMYDEKTIPLAPNRFLPKNAPAFSLVEKNEMWKYSGVPDVADLPIDYARKLKHGYYASVSYMDAQLGRVLDELDRLKLAENTIIVLWGDHGWKLGEHNRWCKHSNVEDDTRAPLIISVPGTKQAGAKTRALTEFVDIYPTLVELAGLEPPQHLEGKSLVPVLNNPAAAHKPIAFSQYHRTVNRRRLMGYSMRTDRYRFTRWLDRKDHSKVIAVELYDHEIDPQENENVADKPGQRETVARLTQQMTEWLAVQRSNAKPTEKQRTNEFVPDQTLTIKQRPKDAIVLFDGTTVAFSSKRGKKPNWGIENGEFISTRGERRSNHVTSTVVFRDADIHVEFMVNKEGNGNSGIYIHGLYELQIFNSDPAETQTQKDLGALYGFAPPLVAAGKPPGEWQVLDVRYIAPRKDAAGKIVRKGEITAWLNGKKVQDRIRFGEPRSKYNPYVYRPTEYLKGIRAHLDATGTGPLVLQDHDNPVRFRNVWIKPLDDKAATYQP